MIEVAGVEYVTATEFAASQSDVTARRVYDWAARGLISPVRVGRSTYYRLDDLWRVERDTRRSTRGRRRAPVA